MNEVERGKMTSEMIRCEEAAEALETRGCCPFAVKGIKTLLQEGILESGDRVKFLAREGDSSVLLWWCSSSEIFKVIKIYRAHVSFECIKKYHRVQRDISQLLDTFGQSFTITLGESSKDNHVEPGNYEARIQIHMPEILLEVSNTVFAIETYVPGENLYPFVPNDPDEIKVFDNDGSERKIWLEKKGDTRLELALCVASHITSQLGNILRKEDITASNIKMRIDSSAHQIIFIITDVAGKIPDFLRRF